MLITKRISKKIKTIGVLLAGGSSTRMKVDKLKLMLPSSQLLIDRQIELLEQVKCDLIVISCKSKLNLNINSKKISKYQQIYDQKNLDGPMAGILSSIIYLLTNFENNHKKLVLFLPIDMPKINSMMLIRLLDQLKTNQFQASIYKHQNLPLSIKIDHQLERLVNQLINVANPISNKKLSVWDFLQMLIFTKIEVNACEKDRLININTQKQWKVMNEQDI